MKPTFNGYYSTAIAALHLWIIIVNIQTLIGLKEEKYLSRETSHNICCFTTFIILHKNPSLTSFNNHSRFDCKQICLISQLSKEKITLLISC
ncbi:CLUMA_CG001450, isoform A [Clunio marinus]|uniref:CLUMA_CG001450, isoform A n=1 Tax=Clunio marinus TaxID=568069 RepID=A0A1J1HN47_9DIPT|nr:CLUMA_CG001450, isoform A [Clunio marinus]